MGDSCAFEGRCAGCRPEHFLVSSSFTGFGLLPGPRGSARLRFRNFVRALQEFRINRQQSEQGPYAKVQQEGRLASFLQLQSMHRRVRWRHTCLRCCLAHARRSGESVDPASHSLCQEAAFGSGRALLGGGVRGHATRGWHSAWPGRVGSLQGLQR